jgi:hypothetical protein
VAQQGSGPPWFGRVPVPGADDQQGYPAGPPGPGPGFDPGPPPGASSDRSSDLGPDEEYPPWAIPEPVRSPRRHRAPGPSDQPGRFHQERRPDEVRPDEVRPDEERREEPDGGGKRRLSQRARATRVRQTKRRLVLGGALVAVAALIAVLVLVVLPGGSTPSSAGADGFITTYQPGEFRSVPSTCDSISAATLGQYLPGKLTQASLPGLSGNSSNQCDWTLDQRPVYRLLQVTATAYAPTGLVSGNGSATSAAEYAYAQSAEGLLHPALRTHQPAALVTVIHGLGTAAFSGFQVIKAGGDTTDRITVVARFRNVVITVEFSGLDHTDQGGYGPVSTSVLQAGAAAVAKDVLAKVH